MSRQAKDDSEVDVVYDRNIYRYLHRPGVASAIKRRMRRRERREGKREAQEVD